jgi:hypothetical protein
MENRHTTAQRGDAPPSNVIIAEVYDQPERSGKWWRVSLMNRLSFFLAVFFGCFGRLF